MDSKVLEKIVEQLTGLIESTGFVASADKTEYKNERYAFKIAHDEERKLLLLDFAEVNGAGEVGEYKNISSWLFDNPEELLDAESAGMDFLDSLKTKMGIRGMRTGKNGEIAMPRKETNGTPNIETLSVKTLAIYPQFKDAYKDHVAKYGSFLYIEFFKETLMVRLAEVLDEGNKKNLKKVFEMLCEIYTEGDRNVQNVIVGVVLCGAVKDNADRYATTLEQLEECSYLKTAFINMMARYKKDKKLREMLA